MELLIGLAVGTVGLAVWGVRRAMRAPTGPRDRALSKLRKLTRARGADVAAGRPCAVVGIVLEPKQQLTAPVSGKPCVAWELRIWVAPPGRDGQMSLVAGNAKLAAVSIEDEDGTTVRVEPDGGVPLLVKFESTGFKRDLPPAVIEALGKHSRHLRGRSGFCDEAILEVGDRVVVGGVGDVEVDPSGVTTDYRTAPTRPVLRSGRRQPLCISNDPDIIKG